MLGAFRDKGYVTREVHPLLEATTPRRRSTENIIDRAQQLKLSWNRKAPSPRWPQRSRLVQRASLLTVGIFGTLRAVTLAGAHEAFVPTVSQPRRAGVVESWRPPSPPPSPAVAVASSKALFVTQSSWPRPIFCLDQSSGATGAAAAAAAVRMSTPASQSGKPGEMPVTDGGDWSDTVHPATEGELVEASTPRLDAYKTAESSTICGELDNDDGSEGGHRATVTPGVRGEKATNHKLAGTWLLAGLPMWVNVVWKRMLTKEDWLHLHAASSLVRDSC